jgi:hypothetical protein
MESLDGRMEDNARKMGRGHPPLDRDKTPGPSGLGVLTKIIYLEIMHKAFSTLKQVSLCWIVSLVEQYI